MNVTQQKTDTVTVDKNGHSKARQVFDVVAYSAVDAAAALASERGIRHGAVYRNQVGESPDEKLRVRTIVPSAKTPPKIGSQALYEVVVDYTQNDSKSLQGVGSGRDKPTFDGVLYRWGRGSSTIEVEVDRNGKVLANPRGEPYEGITLPVPRRTLEARWWLSTTNLVSIFSYDAAVNRSSWRIQSRYRVGKGYALCHGIDPLEDVGDRTLVRGEFEFAPAGHPFDPVRIPAYTIEGGKRQYLDASGNVVQVDPGNDPALVQSFEVVPEARLKDFGALGI